MNEIIKALAAPEPKRPEIDPNTLVFFDGKYHRAADLPDAFRRAAGIERCSPAQDKARLAAEIARVTREVLGLDEPAESDPPDYPPVRAKRPGRRLAARRYE